MKKRLILACALVVLVALGALAIGKPNELRSTDRRAWKAQALAAISARVADPEWSGEEMARLKQSGAKDPDDNAGWLSKSLIVMTNGDWLAYANVCRKENRHIHDLFLAKGSDGLWYYSTYHFCIGMVVLRIEDQSESLAAFTKAYSLRTFDGQSDECLQITWPVKAR